MNGPGKERLGKDGRTDGRMDGRTDKASYRVACPQLKIKVVNLARTDRLTNG